MRKRIIILLLLVLAPATSAHQIVFRDFSVAVRTFEYQSNVSIVVLEGPGELCTVTAQAVEIVIGSPLLSIQSSVQPELRVTFIVTAARHPENRNESAAVQVSWQATGLNTSGAADPGCAGSGERTLTLTVTDPPPPVASVANTATPAVTPTDPIGLFSGEFYFEEQPDINLGGPMALLFQRYHASGLRTSGPLGANWSHNFHFTLSGPTNGNVTIVDNRGRTLTFQQSGSTLTLLSPTFAGYQLVDTVAGYTLGDIIESRFYNFDPNGKLVSIQDRYGNTHTLTYTAGNLTGITDGLGRSLVLAYNGNNRIVSVGDGIRTLQFAYTGENLTAFTDVRGNLTSYQYDNAVALPGLMTKKVLPLGNTMTAQTWNYDGRVISQSDGSDNTFQFAYGPGSSTLQTNPLGDTQNYAFDANGRLLSLTDENGNDLTYTYDAAGRVTSETDSLGNTTQSTYDQVSGKLLTHTEPNGSITSYTYVSQMQMDIEFRVLTRVTYPDGAEHNLTYDAKGQLLSYTDPAGKLSSFTYDSRGQVLTLTNPGGGVSTYTYGADGTVSSVTDASGNITTFGYDALRRANLVTNPDGSQRSYTFDAAGNLLSDTDERGKQASFTYDANGNLKTITDPLGNLTSYSYDAMDRLVSVMDPNDEEATRLFDELGRVASRTDRNGQTFLFSYDPVGHLISVTDPAGNEWNRTYDAEGFALSYTNPLNKAWTYERDALARTVKSTSPDNAVRTFAYNTAGQIANFSDPTGMTTAFTADPRGMLAGVSQGNGLATVTLEHNDIGLLTELTDENGQAWDYAYDSRGRPLSATDPLGRTTTMAYNNMNRLTQLDYPGQLGNVQYTYDALGNLTRKFYSDGTDLTFTYDDSAQLLAATGLTLSYDAAGEIISSNGITVDRDAGGRIVEMSIAPGKTVSYLYDQRDLLTEVTDWAGGVTQFTYDAASRPISIIRPNGVTASFSYNSDDAVNGIQETKTGGAPVSALLLQRDGRGRITSETRTVPLDGMVTAGTNSMSYDAASQLSNSSYDAIGRLLDTGGRDYTWDLASRLMSYRENGDTVSMSYDAFGRRLSRSRAGVSQTYVWNYTFALPSVSVVRQDGDDLRYYVHTPGGALLYSIEAADDARHFYHFDASGNVLYLTDDDGTVTDAYAYTPYGVPLARSGNTDNPFTFAGQMGAMQEEGTELYYMRARFYDAATARFLTRDPASRSPIPAEANVYGYARMNPLLFGDPSGRSAKVNNDGTHTDLTVDVWRQGQIIGTLNVSFGEGGYRASGGSGGVLLNGQGTFVVTFRPGECVETDLGNPNFIPGVRTQDEATARAMLSAVDFSSVGLTNRAPGQPAGDFVQKRIKELGAVDGGGARSVITWSGSAIKGSGAWDTYGVFNGRTCNTFTGEMLNVYFGDNSVPTGVLESSVTENLNTHRAAIQQNSFNTSSQIAPAGR